MLVDYSTWYNGFRVTFCSSSLTIYIYLYWQDEIYIYIHPYSSYISVLMHLQFDFMVCCILLWILFIFIYSFCGILIFGIILLSLLIFLFIAWMCSTIDTHYSWKYKVCFWRLFCESQKKKFEYFKYNHNKTKVHIEDSLNI